MATKVRVEFNNFSNYSNQLVMDTADAKVLCEIIDRAQTVNNNALYNDNILILSKKAQVVMTLITAEKVMTEEAYNKSKDTASDE